MNAAHDRLITCLASPQTSGNPFRHLLLIEDDIDCADALEVLLADLPDVRAVSVSPTAGDALALLDAGLAPDLIFLDSPDDSDALGSTVAALRRAAPGVAITLLCVYPEQAPARLVALVDACLSKDTSRRDLLELLDYLAARR